ncbi:MAG: energy transducer TonB [Balneolaceae bacterium]
MRPTMRNPLASLKRNYVLYFETGLIISLLSTIGLFKMELPKINKQSIWNIPGNEVISSENILLTTHFSIQPNPPPSIFVPYKSPENKLLWDPLRNLQMELKLPDPMPIAEVPLAASNRHFYKPLYETDEKALSYVDIMPQLIGGKEGLRLKIKYPRKAIKDKVQGRVIVQFVVDKRGKVHNPEIVKGVRYDLNKAALRAVAKSRFIPGSLKGKPVAVEYVLFIHFRLEYNS